MVHGLCRGWSFAIGVVVVVWWALVGNGAAAGHRNECLRRIDVRRWFEVVVGPVACHFPTVVVDEEMVSAAEKYTVGDIRSTSFRFPRVDMVRLTIRRRPFTLGESAAAIPDGETCALPTGEQSLLTPNVHTLPVGIESDTDNTGVTQVPVDGGHRDRVVAGLEVPMPHPITGPCPGTDTCGLLKQAGGDHNTHSGAAGSEQGSRVGVDREAHHGGERIRGDLLIGAHIVQQLISSLLIGKVHKPGSTASR